MKSWRRYFGECRNSVFGQSIRQAHGFGMAVND